MNVKSLLLVLLIALPIWVFGHPVSLSWAEVKIDGNKMSIYYKILAEDLVLFHHPDHDESYNYERNKLIKLAQYHATVIMKNFKVENALLETLVPNLSDINYYSLIQEEINVRDLMKHEISYRFDYSLKDENWEKLTFSQKISETGNGIPAVTFISVTANGERLTENVQISLGDPFELRQFGNNTTQNPSDLTSSFFTVSESGIRHELTIPFSVLNSFMRSDHEMNIQVLTRYFKNYNPVIGNNVRLNPNITYYKLLQDEANIYSNNGLIYMDIQYPSATYPSKVALQWDDYNWQFRWFNSMIIATDSSFIHTFSRFQPIIEWETHINAEDN